MTQLSIRLFGQFEVQRDGQFLDDQAWRSRQNRTILQVLISRRGNVVTADQLLDILWPDTETSAARRRLHVRVSQLRRALDLQWAAAYIETISGGYAFSASAGCWIDVEQFESQAERGRRVWSKGRERRPPGAISWHRWAIRRPRPCCKAPGLYSRKPAPPSTCAKWPIARSSRRNVTSSWLPTTGLMVGTKTPTLSIVRKAPAATTMD